LPPIAGPWGSETNEVPTGSQRIVGIRCARPHRTPQRRRADFNNHRRTVPHHSGAPDPNATGTDYIERVGQVLSHPSTSNGDPQYQLLLGDPLVRTRHGGDDPSIEHVIADRVVVVRHDPDGDPPSARRTRCRQ
jgi:hypothetical protein